MGSVLSCFSSSKNKPQTTNNATKPQTFSASTPAQQDAQQGLRDEHLSVVPPPTAIDTPNTQASQGTEATSTQAAAVASGEAARRAAVEAPVPVPVPIASDTSGDREGEMASDGDYASFLDKANQDPGEGVSEVKGGKMEFRATEQGVQVPKCIVDVVGGEGMWYTSDADERFVGVALKVEGGKLPTEDILAKTIGHPDPKSAEVEIMDVGEWDTQGEYKDMVNAVREAGKGADVRVYRVRKDGSRFEYWVVTVVGGDLVGAKVLAVES